MSRKQYYSRIAKLVKVDLIQRRQGKCALTSFGKIIYNAQVIISKAVENHWKFEVIDAMNDENALSSEDYSRMIDVLLDDVELKEIICKQPGKVRGKSE